MASTPGERLKARWMPELRVDLRLGVSEGQIRAFERRRGVRLPTDMREYFSVVNGPGRYYGIGDLMSCFWSLDELTPLSEEFPDATTFEEPDAWFLFADQAINFPSYTIRLSAQAEDANPVIAVLSDNREYSSWRVAESFTGFVEEFVG